MNVESKDIQEAATRETRSESAPRQRSLGLATCTALVIGNMIGSGFFIAPSALAPYGTTAIIGWGVMAFGAVCLGLVFARLARIAPATGGPYAYTRMGFGRFAGFIIAWGYWISIWASLPAMAAALVGYLAALIPSLQDHALISLAIALGSIWLVAMVNLRGAKAAGIFMATTTYTKLVPFISIAVFGLFWVDWGTFATINPSDKPFLSALAATAPLTMFAFLGIESATVPAGDVVDPDKTIPRATILGTLISSMVYILGTTVVLGVIPRDTLIHSGAPFADAAGIIRNSRPLR
jgi:APA family basic amino acid/polyamine antiporter